MTRRFASRNLSRHPFLTRNFEGNKGVTPIRVIASYPHDAYICIRPNKLYASKSRHTYGPYGAMRDAIALGSGRVTAEKNSLTRDRGMADRDPRNAATSDADGEGPRVTGYGTVERQGRAQRFLVRVLRTTRDLGRCARFCFPTWTLAPVCWLRGHQPQVMSIEVVGHWSTRPTFDTCCRRCGRTVSVPVVTC